jgi:hypothetical protein
MENARRPRPKPEFGRGALERRSISEQVDNRILSMIKSGNLKSGDRLPTEAQMGNLPKLADLIFHRLFVGAARITPARFGRVLGKICLGYDYTSRFREAISRKNDALSFGVRCWVA